MQINRAYILLQIVANGHASADWQAQLRRCHDELGFRYVRFHGLLSEHMGTLVGHNEGLLYSFFNVDQIVDFILSIGMKPFVELSFMPKAIASARRALRRCLRHDDGHGDERRPRQGLRRLDLLGHFRWKLFPVDTLPWRLRAGQPPRHGTELLPVEGAHGTVDAWVIHKGPSLTVLLANHALPRHAIETEQVRRRWNACKRRRGWSKSCSRARREQDLHLDIALPTQAVALPRQAVAAITVKFVHEQAN